MPELRSKWGSQPHAQLLVGTGAQPLTNNNVAVWGAAPRLAPNHANGVLGLWQRGVAGLGPLQGGGVPPVGAQGACRVAFWLFAEIGGSAEIGPPHL